jgi:TolB protein
MKIIYQSMFFLVTLILLATDTNGKGHLANEENIATSLITEMPPQKLEKSSRNAHNAHKETYIQDNKPIQKRLTINISKGVSQQIPIAVLAFTGSHIHHDSIPEGIAGVISDDLKNSGRFRSSMPPQPQQIISLAKIDWEKLSAEYAVIGTIKKTAEDHYQVSYKLVSKVSNRIISGRQFNNIHKKNFRRLAHTISNFIYEAITGSQGYFTSKIAYIDVENPYELRKSIYQLVVADYDGFNPHVLLRQNQEPILSPNWSKDGKYIAYVSYDKGSMAIYTLDVYQGVRKKIANFKGINSAPVFSPSGTSMAMALSQGYSENTNIYLMNLNNDVLYQKLTQRGINTAPAFSPSGKALAYVSNQGGSPQVYITNVDSKNSHPDRLTFGVREALDPQYTPSGKTIVFMSQKEKGSGTQIAKVDLNNKQITVLTHGIMDSSPSVSPDGNMIIYRQGLETGGAKLAMVSIDGDVEITLPSNIKGDFRSPAWSHSI